MLHATALCSYKILYSVYIENILYFEGWKSGTGNRKSTNLLETARLYQFLNLY